MRINANYFLIIMRLIVGGDLVLSIKSPRTGNSNEKLDMLNINGQYPTLTIIKCCKKNDESKSLHGNEHSGLLGKMHLTTFSYEEI